MATLKMTADEIVRQHRNAMQAQQEDRYFEAMRHKSFRVPWYKAVNWDIALSWFLGGLTGVCAGYVLLFVLVPFVLELLLG